MMKAAPLFLLLLSFGAPASSAEADSRVITEPVRVDHVILGVSDLESGIDEFERRTGVRAAYGGVHPGRGTRNALVSLGQDVYLEIYAPNPDEPVKSGDGPELRQFKTLTPFGWAVNTQDAEALSSQLNAAGLAVGAARAGSRDRPDGSRLEWVAFGFTEFDNPLAPFFIRWSEMGAHPSRTSPGGCTLASISIRDPEPARLKSRVDPLKLPADVASGPARRMKIELSCPAGQVIFE